MNWHLDVGNSLVFGAEFDISRSEVSGAKVTVTD